ncbi:efflux RND transporter permease subunit [Pseudoalteromonas arctica]|uniref:MMPL family transporter n=1 Tax=Pseudoalteromonas arctica TaxID=394751 RepID=A0A7Y0DW62_9GAMM|nr:MMPL family transporter [Pseudoalteromonas arctica]NMM42715.1 MMPL family transporter [Pseudoalteromonas arctica]
MLEKYLDFVFRYPKSILALLVLITAYFLVASANLSEDNNPYFLPQDHPARSTIFDLREEFTGTHDSVLIALSNDNTVFNQASINAIFDLSRVAVQMNYVDQSDAKMLKQLQAAYPENRQLITRIDTILADGMTPNDGLLARELVSQSATWQLTDKQQRNLRVFAERLDPVREVAGLSSTENVFLDEHGTMFAQETVNQRNQDIEFVKNAVQDNELIEFGSISPDGKVALIVVELSILEDDAIGQVRAYEAFKQLVSDYQEAHPELKDDIYISGVPVFFAAQKQVIDHDFATLLPIVILLITVILAVFFKTILGVVIPLINVVMCTVWTMGMMAIVNAPLDVITAILPVFLLTICLSDAIHVMAEYYHQKKINKSRLVAIRKAMILMVSPVVLTTITTCLTFTMSTSSSIESLRNFGLFISFGMFVALIISLLLIPALLALFPNKDIIPTSQTVEDSSNNVSEKYFISRLLVRTLTPVIANRKVFTVVFIGLFVGSCFLASQVRVDDMGAGYFPEQSNFRISDDFINNHIAGTSPGWIEVDTGIKNGALTLEVAHFIDQLEQHIHQHSTVNYSYSLARYVRRINYTLNDFDPQYNRLPNEVERFTEIDEDTQQAYEVEIAGSDIIRQSILLFENSRGSDVTNVLNEDFSKTVLLYTLGTTVANDYQSFLDHTLPWIEKNKPEGVTITHAGSPIIWTAVLDALVKSQTVSASIALLTVLLVMITWFKSIRLGLAGTLPLLSTVMIYFALMTVLNIELNIGTAIISFLVLGIVDYSVHYILRIQHEIQNGHSINHALLNAMRVSGRAIIANVLVFSIGFIALLFSQHKALIDLGTLVGLSLLISGMVTLFVITLFAPWFFKGELKVRESKSADRVLTAEG